MTAFVRAESAPSRSDTSTLYVGRLTSTKTGTAPYWMIGATVVGKPAATVMTSSPRPTARAPRSGDVSAIKASRFADEPEFTSEQCFTPR